MSDYFNPGFLPDEGVLHQDGNCFEYSFLSGSFRTQSKNIFFLLDTTNSGYELFFSEAKTSLKAALDILTPPDTVTIQAFGQVGTDVKWGPAKATDSEKLEAKQLVDQLQVYSESYRSNLHEALMKGLLRGQSDTSMNNRVVTLMVVLSNSWDMMTNRSKIANDVWNLKKEGDVSVKFFTLGSANADLELLRAIATMNGGVAAPLADDTTGLTSQMQSFFETEFGNILLSEAQVTLVEML
jgi:hypothetical protein